jgi:hypothetical protein
MAADVMTGADENCTGWIRSSRVDTAEETNGEEPKRTARQRRFRRD